MCACGTWSTDTRRERAASVLPPHLWPLDRVEPCERAVQMHAQLKANGPSTAGPVPIHDSQEVSRQLAHR